VILDQRQACPDERRQHPRADQDRTHPLRVWPERAGEDGEVHARKAVDAELAHRPGEQQTGGRQGHRVGVGEPEVERNDRRLDEEAGGDQRERDDHQAVGRRPRQRLACLSQVERPGAPVEQRDPGQKQERPDDVGDREVERSLDRLGLVDLVAGERERGDAHQLEKDEHVEEVA
jgi:hypothetical protein